MVERLVEAQVVDLKGWCCVGGGSFWHIFLGIFTPKFGEDGTFWRSYFFGGLVQPPTRVVLVVIGDLFPIIQRKITVNKTHWKKRVAKPTKTFAGTVTTRIIQPKPLFPTIYIGSGKFAFEMLLLKISLQWATSNWKCVVDQLLRGQDEKEALHLLQIIFRYTTIYVHVWGTTILWKFPPYSFAVFFKGWFPWSWESWATLAWM